MKPPNFFPEWLQQLAFHQQCMRVPFSLHPFLFMFLGVVLVLVFELST
jgi:hypothetical protein